MIEEGLNTLSKAVLEVEKLRQRLREHGLDQLPETQAEPSEHRREHRFGRPPKIDSDPELQAFLLARIDRMTFAEMAADVAQHFPKDRRTGKSSIHLWWSKRKDN